MTFFSDSRSFDAILSKSAPHYSKIIFSLIMIDAFLNFAIDLLNLLLLNVLLNIVRWQQFSLNSLRFAFVSITATSAEVKEIGKPKICDRYSKVFRHHRGQSVSLCQNWHDLHHPEWQLDTLAFLKICLRASWCHKCLNTQGNSVPSGSPKSCI